MIGGLRGTLGRLDADTATIDTAGGVSYEVLVPLGVLGRLPAPGGAVHLHTELVVREDAWLLVGFDTPGERLVFRRLLTASGFGPRLALAMLSALGPDRTVRAILANDLAALSSVSGVGKKKAERLVLELRDRFEDLEPPEPGTKQPSAPSPPAEAAVKALVRLGYAPAAAEEAVRDALTGAGDDDTAQLVRRALLRLAPTRGGR